MYLSFRWLHERKQGELKDFEIPFEGGNSYIIKI